MDTLTVIIEVASVYGFSSTAIVTVIYFVLSSSQLDYLETLGKLVVLTAFFAVGLGMTQTRKRVTVV